MGAHQPASHRPKSSDFLIASDDEQLRETAHTALRRLGFPASFVRSGLDVVNQPHRVPHRLMLLDQSLRDIAGLEVARAITADMHQRFILVGESLSTSITVAAMKLGAFTVLEKPVPLTDMVALLRSAIDESGSALLTKLAAPILRAPRSVAERWALKVLKGCEADGDLRTLAAWAKVAGSSYSSLCEMCRLLGIQPLAARDLTRVLRALVKSHVDGGRIAELLDICDRRTLNALMRRAAVDPRRPGRETSVEQFLTSQCFVPVSNAGVTTLRTLLAAGRRPLHRRVLSCTTWAFVIAGLSF
jgi:ActR/RegA family two-component response regulator